MINKTHRFSPHQEIASNYIWLRPICQRYPRSVPGQVFLADVMLMLDKYLEGRLLVKADVGKVAQACEEGGRLKRLMGSLRYLFRNSNLAIIVCIVFLFCFLVVNGP